MDLILCTTVKALLSVYLTWKTHNNVCTDHCCANFFLSHVKLLCSLMRKRHWRTILADPDSPRWLMPQAGHSHQLRFWHEQVACSGRAQANRFCWLLLLVVATAAPRGFSYVISDDLGWTCADSPAAKTRFLCLLSPWASSGERHSSPNKPHLATSRLFWINFSKGGLAGAGVKAASSTSEWCCKLLGRAASRGWRAVRAGWEQQPLPEHSQPCSWAPRGVKAKGSLPHAN